MGSIVRGVYTLVVAASICISGPAKAEALIRAVSPATDLNGFPRDACDVAPLLPIGVAPRWWRMPCSRPAPRVP